MHVSFQCIVVRQFVVVVALCSFRFSLEIWISHYRCSRADTILQRSLMHFRTMMRHTKTNVQVMWIVMRLWRWPMIMIITIIVIVILLRRLALRVLLVFHATILKPDFNLWNANGCVRVDFRRLIFDIIAFSTWLCTFSFAWIKNIWWGWDCWDNSPVFRSNSDSSPTPNASASTRTHWKEILFPIPMSGIWNMAYVSCEQLPGQSIPMDWMECTSPQHWHQPTN